MCRRQLGADVFELFDEKLGRIHFGIHIGSIPTGKNGSTVDNVRDLDHPGIQKIFQNQRQVFIHTSMPMAGRVCVTALLQRQRTGF